MESCKDCHNCAFDLMCTYMGDWVGIRTPCPAFKDKSRFVELPCEIGAELFRIKQINGKAFVTNTTLNKNTFWEIVIKGEFGKTVFLTREEAEQALKERENSV